MGYAASGQHWVKGMGGPDLAGGTWPFSFARAKTVRLGMVDSKSKTCHGRANGSKGAELV